MCNSPIIHDDPTVVISAARTKDAVRIQPDVLAAIITGERPCLFGRHPTARILDPRRIHTLVLWTKDPTNILQHPSLAQACRALVENGVQVTLQLSVTGFGSTLVEPGIPPPRQTLVVLERLFACGLLSPATVTLRYDPLFRLAIPQFGELSNASMSCFIRTVSPFLELGLSRIVTSRADLTTYPRIRTRLEMLGLEHCGPDEDEACQLIDSMARHSRRRGARLLVCCDPPWSEPESNQSANDERRGCLDGSLYNRIADLRRYQKTDGEDLPNESSSVLRCPETLHNTGGRQRDRCLCTASRDIGYSRGLTHCFTSGSGCLYCYSQGASLAAAEVPIRRELQRLLSKAELSERDPYESLRA